MEKPDKTGVPGSTAVSAEGMAPVPETRRASWLKRLYNWVLHWAETPYGVPALCVLAFVESSFFPIPPDVLLIALCMGAVKKSLRFVFWCSLFSVLGGVFGYYIGYAFYDLVGARIIAGLGLVEQFEAVKSGYGEYGLLAIVTAGFTPVPYKVFTIAAGVCHESISLGTLVLGSLIGRTGRFLLVGGAIYLFGAPVKRYIDKYLEIFCILFLALLIGSFALLKVLVPNGKDTAAPPAPPPAQPSPAAL
ncbi:MAG: DedA family protein [Puniceicoccales bacterium]|jgi:membrane protein YqaA with SNARE-associated domain|nr:DedA family protein [Puniceicoccales bacterium]